MANSRTQHRDYFVSPHPFWIVAIIFGLWLLSTTTFAPNRLPSWLGPLGQFAQYVGTNYHQFCIILFIIVLTIHCLEAAYAEKLCIDKGLSMTASIKWTLSSLVFGIASLVRLMPYKPDKKTT